MRDEARVHLLVHRADFWRLRRSVRTRTIPSPLYPDRKLFMAEDDPQAFFGRPPPWEPSQILRWEICVEALCQITGERAIAGTLTKDEDEEDD